MVISFTSGKQALEYLKTNSASLMLTDVDMPGMNGIELIKAIKGLKPNLPVLVMTGTSCSEAANEMVRLGFPDYITKPFELNYLESRIVSRIHGNALPTKNNTNYEMDQRL